MLTVMTPAASAKVRSAAALVTASGAYQELCVKNLETAQGDERDIIFLGV